MWIVHRSGADSPSFGWCDRPVGATLCCCRLSAYSASCKLRIVQRFAAIDNQLLQPGRLVINSKKDKYFFRRPFQDQALAVYCNAYVSLQFMADFETKRAHGGLLYSIVDLFFVQAYKADQVAFSFKSTPQTRVLRDKETLILNKEEGFPMVDLETKTAHSRLLYNIFDLFLNAGLQNLLLSPFYCSVIFAQHECCSA